jgi:hypothetical protein
VRSILAQCFVEGKPRVEEIAGRIVKRRIILLVRVRGTSRML